MLYDGREPFCIIRRKNEPTALVLSGKLVQCAALDDIPRRRGTKGPSYDSVSLIPYSQIRERNYRARVGEERILSLDIERQESVPVEQLMRELPRETLTLSGQVSYDYDRPAYVRLIRHIIDDEIGTGQGSNFVIPRTGRTRIADFGPAKALTIFGNLLRNEYGAYWTFVFFDGRTWFVGATPERHISVRKGEVKMNPISGTFRKGEHGGTPEDVRKALLGFLQDEKEIFELFMVVDEELKMMSQICDQGGMIIGPLLKEMSRLVHTEYLLQGTSSKDLVEILRTSMFAPTVTGSPLESACRIIDKYETTSRRYYGGALALIGHDETGEETLDAPITIRTVEIDSAGELRVQVGATLVRNSNPEDEVKETEAKVAGVLAALGPAPARPTPFLTGGGIDEEIVATLQKRNTYLSKFWMEPQSAELRTVDSLVGRPVVIVDNEDSFSCMLRHMLMRMGAQVDVVRFSEYRRPDPNVLVVLGPGPGDPEDENDPKMATIRQIAHDLIGDKYRFLGVCLGHQVLCSVLGFKLRRKTLPYQGKQEIIDLFGQKRRVGFYNSFTAMVPSVPIKDVEVAFDAETSEVHAIRGPHFMGVQFHAESVLTPDGYEIVRDAFAYLLRSAS